MIVREKELTGKIIGAAIKVHKTLGPGLLESAYQQCLKWELEKIGLFVETEVPIPVVYEEVKLDYGYRADLVIERKIIIELKCVDLLKDVHEAQILTYMRFGGYKVGLLINFNVKILKNGIRRFVLW